MSQVSLDDILEYTSNNEELLVGVQPLKDDEQVPDFVPDSSAQQEIVPDPPPLGLCQGYHPNTDIFAITKQELSYRAGKGFVPLAPPTAQMLQAAAEPRIGELIPQDHPEWQNLRSGKVTGSSLAEFLGLFEALAGRALTKAGVYAKMRDHSKLTSKVLSLQNPKQGLMVVEPQTQIFFDWGHKHEANGILSYLNAYPSSVVHEVGFVLLDPTLQSLPPDICKGINPADLPVIGSSPDGIIVEAPTNSAVTHPLQASSTGATAGHDTPVRPSHQHNSLLLPQQRPPAQNPHRHWRHSNPSHRRVLEIKAKTPFRPDSVPGVWRWLGASCKPYTKILPQYFAQAQLNMLVTNSGSCHLLCYTVKGGSKVFNIPLDKQWCNQMLHWVAQLNVCYVRKGLEPPENVFWEQDAYRAFVDITRVACQKLDNSSVEVPSLRGPVSQPWFLAAIDATVPNTPEAGSADQLSQQQLQWQLQDQIPPQSPPGWQQQQQFLQLPTAHGQAQQRAEQQEQQQQQQQQHSSFNGSVASSSEARAGGHQPAAQASLRLLAAAAIPLPDEDIAMEDAHPFAAPQGECEPTVGYPQQVPSPSESGPVGAWGLAYWMQHICDHHQVDLRPLLDSSCQSALSLLAAADIQHILKQLVEDVKRNASALCKKHISHLTASDRKATRKKKKKTESPRRSASKPTTAAPKGLRAASHGPGAASNGPGVADTRPGLIVHQKPDAMDIRADVTHPEGAADSAATRPFPCATEVQGLVAIAAKSALPGSGAGATSPFACVPGAAAVLPSPGSAFASPDAVRAVPSGAGIAHGPQATHTRPSPDAPAAAAQRVLWPDSNDCWVTHVTAVAKQPGVPTNNPEGRPSGSRPELSRVAAAGSGAAAGLFQEPREISASSALFGAQLLPADMAPNVKRRLQSVVAQHQQYLAPHDFDAAILERLAKMPEHKAISVLNQAESASWAKIHNNTRMIMSWCVKWGGQ